MACNLTTSPLPSLLHSYVPQSLRPFVTLSYPITDPLAHPSAQTLYDKGPQDACLVLFWALAFTLLREAFMKGVFSPFMRICLPSPPQIKGQEREYAKARKKREHTVTRFAEQGWSWLYCSIYWTFGVIVLRQNPSPTSPEQLWGTYPAVPLPALTKFYYLSQLGWWFHQLLVINCEKRRKDHWQMFGHHILTITLVVGRGFTSALSPCSPSSGSSPRRGFTWLATSRSAWYEVWALKTREVMMSPKRMRWSKCQRV